MRVYDELDLCTRMQRSIPLVRSLGHSDFELQASSYEGTSPGCSQPKALSLAWKIFENPMSKYVIAGILPV